MLKAPIFVTLLKGFLLFSSLRRLDRVLILAPCLLRVVC
jgi:hypothetical protein